MIYVIRPFLRSPNKILPSETEEVKHRIMSENGMNPGLFLLFFVLVIFVQFVNVKILVIFIDLKIFIRIIIIII
ncbi:hypothetical protein KH172YL63_40900 [Bacillus sp. KH172YL63]|nr:hypothetical protein KH172YL63_40900 [Bacillus sp. KH172YL63]